MKFKPKLLRIDETPVVDKCFVMFIGSKYQWILLHDLCVPGIFIVLRHTFFNMIRIINALTQHDSRAFVSRDSR